MGAVDLAAGSTVLAAVSLASMWLLARKHPAGWVVAITAQIIWLPYDVLTRQYGFIAITVVSVPVYWRGWRNFRKAGDDDAAATDSR